MDLGKLPMRPAFEKLPRRWVAKRTSAEVSKTRRTSTVAREAASVAGSAFKNSPKSFRQLEIPSRPTSPTISVSRQSPSDHPQTPGDCPCA